MLYWFALQSNYDNNVDVSAQYWVILGNKSTPLTFVNSGSDIRHGCTMCTMCTSICGSFQGRLTMHFITLSSSAVGALCRLSHGNISYFFIYFLMIILSGPTWLKHHPCRGQRVESVVVFGFLLLFLTQPEDAVQPLPFMQGRDWPSSDEPLLYEDYMKGRWWRFLKCNV